MIIEPIVEPLWGKILVALGAYLVTLGFSGVIVRFFVLPKKLAPTTRDPDGPRFDSSVVIGKCENILTVTFILANQATGLALIFAGKSLVRSDDIKKNPGFFLGGTLVNLVWALLVAAVARVLMFGA